MTGGVPKRPGGSSARARFYQWVWDSIVSHRRPGAVRGAKVSSTTGGVFVEPLGTGLGTGDSRVRQYLLTDATNGDYFICRTLSQTLDSESETMDLSIGATDVYIAKPFHLRQSPFDRDVINAEDPGNIGTVDEITYDVVVESWVDPDLLTETRRLSFDYKSATFRIATDESEEDPDDWTSENQTIIPRFVSAVLVEEEDEPITTETISPTIIYAVKCSGLGVTRPDDPELPEEEQTQLDVTLLALNDGWAWAKTFS